MNDWVVLGRVSGLFGVNGWVRVFSHTEPRDGITRYQPVFLKRQNEWREFQIEAGRALNDHGYILPGLGDAGDRIYGTR